MAYSDSHIQPRLVSIPKAAALLSIGRTKTYDLISAKVLETVTIGTRRLVTLRSIDRLIDQSLVGEAA
jgi:excisionase family DNA binding protein